MDYSYSTSSNLTDPAAIWGIVMASLGIALLIAIPLYIYSAWALMTIAKKTNTANAWLAWIPIANLYLMTQIAQVPWWTMLVILIAWIPILGSLALLGVMIWWWWKICEKRNFPGWWSLLITFIPIVNLVMLGIVAWSEKK